MDFVELIAPMAEAQFMADYWGKRPLHVPASRGSNRAAVTSWTQLNRLLQIRPHWSDAHIKLVLNSAPVASEHFLETLPDGRRLACPAKIEVFMAMGASLVADAIEQISPEVRQIAYLLARRFAGRAGANLYASFQGVQAFASHCDLHEVFAIQCDGEKRWRIYANRAQDPLVALEGPDAQHQIDAAKGPVLMEVTTRPGDLLYIPRGYFHDALASTAESLHLTFGVAPHTGRILFRLLEELAIADPAFRAYLPDARQDDGAELRARLSELAARIGALAASEALLDEVAVAQRRLMDPVHELSLPERPELAFFARTDRHAEIVRAPEGVMLIVGAECHRVGAVADAAEYLLARPAVSLQEVRANFVHHPPESIDALVALAARLDLLRPYYPKLG